MEPNTVEALLAHHGVSLTGSETDVGDALDAFFAHYGVRGMRWGFRKRSKSEERERAKQFKPASAADAAKVKDASKKKVVTGTITKPDGSTERATGILTNTPTGAQFRKMSDHEYARYLAARPRTTLSNTELRELTTRLELESKYNKFFPSKADQYQARAKNILGYIKTGQEIATLTTKIKAAKAAP